MLVKKKTLKKDFSKKLSYFYYLQEFIQCFLTIKFVTLNKEQCLGKIFHYKSHI